MLPRIGKMMLGPLTIRLLLGVLVVLLVVQVMVILSARRESAISVMVSDALAEETARAYWLRLNINGDPAATETAYDQRLDRFDNLLHEIMTAASGRALQSELRGSVLLREAVVNAELRAIQHALAGNQALAQAALDQPDYHSLQKRSAAQMAASLRAVQVSQAGRISSALWLTALCSVAMLACGWVFNWLARRLTRRKALAIRRADEMRNLRAVMASVMDAFNNFLNASLLFRLRAENRALTDEELTEFDKASESARDQLLLIAETAVIHTRDIGGLHILDIPNASGPVATTTSRARA